MTARRHPETSPDHHHTAMRPKLIDWLVTIRVDESRTRDLAIRAESAYNAGWLCRELNPGVKVLAIRHSVKPRPEPIA